MNKKIVEFTFPRTHIVKTSEGIVATFLISIPVPRRRKMEKGNEQVSCELVAEHYWMESSNEATTRKNVQPSGNLAYPPLATHLPVSQVMINCTSSPAFLRFSDEICSRRGIVRLFEPRMSKEKDKRTMEFCLAYCFRRLSLRLIVCILRNGRTSDEAVTVFSTL